ncbi:MAG: ketoacyl-ACP synthase III [Anaerolineae bacterium]|nr:ketoacyl-ACP synthase III [Anaerolineae bacterium]
MNRYATISGWGMYVPDRIMTNHELSLMVDTSDDWIRSRTGIQQRHIVDAKEATSDLATRAGWAALHSADIGPEELDLVIVATCSPDYHLPATACLVQDRLGASRAGAFDVNAACSGFVYALSMANSAIVSGAANKALVIGAEAITRWIDWTQRDICVLFGDGAGAVVLEATDRPSGLLSYVLGSDGSGGEMLMMRNGGSRLPPKGNLPLDGGLNMNGKEVYRFATRIMGKAAREAISRAGLTSADIDLFIPHQANLRIIESAAKSLDVPMSKVFVNVQKYGNTSAASIPIAICEAANEGYLQPGQNVCLIGFGAGLTWAAATLRWMPLRTHPSQSVPKRVVRWSRAPLARVKSLIHRAERRVDGLEDEIDRREWLRERLRRDELPHDATPMTNGHGQGSSNGHAHSASDQPTTATPSGRPDSVTPPNGTDKAN